MNFEQLLLSHVLSAIDSPPGSGLATNTLGRRRGKAGTIDCDYSGPSGSTGTVGVQGAVGVQGSHRGPRGPGEPSLSPGEDNQNIPTREPNGARAIVVQNIDEEAHEVRLSNERSEFYLRSK